MANSPYKTWNLTEKTFLTALLMSFLWHAFWFFSVHITVSGDKKPRNAHPTIVALGPVLDDTIFRTLAENKPEYSETFYRRLSDYSAHTELEPAVLTKYSAGEVVSVSLGKRAWESIKNLIGGDKSFPDFLAPAMRLGESAEESRVEGEVKDREVLSRPPLPLFPFGIDAAYKFAEAEFDFTVEAEGAVGSVQLVRSSGNPEVDGALTHYLKGWQFSPVGLNGSQAGPQKGRVRLSFDRSGRK